MKVSDRISVSGYLGTIKYVGTLPKWGPGTLVYGIEWDDKSRGKNSGSVDGVSYFHTSVAGAGSFIKASNKQIDQPVSFLDAVRLRYAGETNERALEERFTIGKKVVEQYGLQRLNEMQRDVHNLEVVMVERLCISKVDDMPGFPRARSLDVSFNLLTQWADIGRLCRAFPALESLNLNGLRLIDETAFDWPPSLRHLQLSATNLGANQIRSMNLHPVRRLELASNDLTGEALGDWIPGVESLDLLFNPLQTLSLDLSNLSELVLVETGLANLQCLPASKTLTKLDLRHNPIRSFEDIDCLQEKFPALQELRLSHCPVFENMSAEEMTFSLIGRLTCASSPGHHGIYKLNGSTLQEQEITNAELYFVSKVKSSAVPMTSRRRWQQLVDKYELANDRPVSETSAERYLVLFRRIESPTEELFARRFLPHSTVLLLKGAIARRIGMSVLDFSVHYFVNDDEASYGATRQEMHDDIALLHSLGLASIQRIFISV